MQKAYFSLYSMHINYFGDVEPFTGFAMLTTSAWSYLIPLITTVGLVDTEPADGHSDLAR